MRSARGLGWMIVAQACFAWMNVCTRSGAGICPGRRSRRCASSWARCSPPGSRSPPGARSGVTDRAGTLAAQHLRHPGRAGQLLRAGIEPRPRRRRGHPWRHHADLRRPALAPAPRRARGPPRRAGGGARVRRGGRARTPAFALAWPVALVATVGAFFYALAMIWLRRIGPGESHEAIVLHFSLVGLATMVAARAARVALARMRRAGWPCWARASAAAARSSP